MVLPITDSYQIKTSKTNHKIPVINGIHLHSMYHPIREAENFISNHMNLLQEKNNILILGLGFGYHVNQIIIELRKVHGENFSVFVIEPNSQVANDCFSLDLLINENLKIFHGLSHDRLYLEKDLVDFLLTQPGIIAHPASFNLYKNYFKGFLQYKASVATEQVSVSLKTEEIKQYISERFQPEENFELAMSDYIQSNHKIVNQMDFLFFALEEMAPLNRESQK